MSDRFVPIYVGRDNCEAALGRPWRGVQDLAAALGVRPRRIGRVVLYPADELAAAIERHAATAPAEPAEIDDSHELEAMRRRLGKQKRRA